MKYSRTAIGLLTAQYRSVLKKCLLINLGLYALGAVAATPAMADQTVITDNATLSGETYQNSTANDDGGVFFVNAEGKTVEINSSAFTGNSVTGEGATGGAISLRRGTLNIDDTVFTNNTAPYSGAIFTYSAGNKLKITNSQFNSNVALGAGALQAMFETEIKNTSFTGNRATEDSSGAGALFVGAVGKTKLDNVTFTENTSATRGGAIGSRSFTLGDNHAAMIDIASSEFKNNTAATLGGAINNFMYNSTSHEGAVFVGSSTFTSNSATNGGAVYNHIGKDGDIKVGGETQIAKIYFKDTNFTDNTASEKGGALYNEGEATIAANAADVAFSGNTAGGVANDIFNLGTLTLNAASGRTISLAGGIDGDANNKGTTNIEGDGIVQIANALKNQNVKNTGNLVLDGANLDGTKIEGNGSVKVEGNSEVKETTLTDQTLEVEAGKELKLTDVKLTETTDGKGTVTNLAGGTLNIKGTDNTKSVIGVKIDNYGRLISDPTTYNDTVNNNAGAYASFTNDTFASTGVLNNLGTVDLNTVTFDSGASITGNGTTNLVSGTTAFNNTANSNTINLASGANWSGVINGGIVNTINGAIDSSITGSVSNTTTAYVDAQLGDTGTIDAVKGGTISKIKLTSASSYGSKDSVTLTAAEGSTFDSNVEIEGLNYYTQKTVSGNTLTLSDKLVNTSTIRGTGNGSTSFTDDVVLGDKAATTTIGTPASKILLNSEGTVAITGATTVNGTLTAGATTVDSLKFGTSGTPVSSVVTSIGSSPTDAQLPTALAVKTALGDKQDTLVAGSNIQIAADGKTISATDTTYTAGAGITITGATNAIAVDLDTITETANHKVMTTAERTAIANLATTYAGINGDALKDFAAKDLVATNVSATNISATTATVGGASVLTANSALNPENITQTSSYRFVTDAEKVAWNGKISGVQVNGAGLTPTSGIVNVTVATGTGNGTIAVNGSDVAVAGLGTAAYTAATDYASSAQGSKADSALQSVSGETYITKSGTGIVANKIGFSNINTAAIQNGSTSSDKLTTKSYVDEGLAGVDNKFTTLAAEKASTADAMVHGSQIQANTLGFASLKTVDVATSANIASTVAAASDSKLVTEKAVVAGLAGKQATITNTATIVTDGTGLKVNNASIGATQLDTATNASLAKANNAIQGVKLNGTAITPDSDKVVDVQAVTGITVGTNPATVTSGVVTLGAVAGANYATPLTTTNPTDNDIATWATTNAANVANVGTTFDVLSKKLTNVETDLLTGTGAHSIAGAMATDGNAINTQTKTLADGQIAASIADTSTAGALGTLLAGKANVALDNINEAGQNVVKDLAGDTAGNGLVYNTTTNELAVKLDGTTLAVDGDGLKVNAIEQSQVNGLGDALNAKTTITAKTGTATNQYTIANSKETGGESQDFYNVTGTNAVVDGAVQKSGDDINFYNTSSATDPEATTLTKAAITTALGTKADLTNPEQTITAKAYKTANWTVAEGSTGNLLLQSGGKNAAILRNTGSFTLNGTDGKQIFDVAEDGKITSNGDLVLGYKTDDQAVLTGAKVKGYDTATALVNDGTKGNEALYTALGTKQDALTASDGINIDADNKISVALKDKGGLQFDDVTSGSKTISVKVDGTTLVNTEGTLGVGTIEQSQVNGLPAALNAKTTIAAKDGSTTQYTIANSAVSQDFYNVTGTDNAISSAITTAAADYAKLAGGNTFTGDQNFNGKSVIMENGTAGFGMNDAGTYYALVVQKDAVTANPSILAKSGIKFGSKMDSAQYGITGDGAATLASATVGGNAVLTTADKLDGAISTESTTAQNGLVSADQVKAYAQNADQVKTAAQTAANGVVTLGTDADEGKINFNTQSGDTTTVEATTYNVATIDNKLADKMNTADWTVDEIPATGGDPVKKLNGNKLATGSVAFSALDPNAITTSDAIAALIADPTSAVDTKLVTEKALVASIDGVITSKEAWFDKEFGYDVHTTDAPTVLGNAGFKADDAGNLGFSQAIIQNRAMFEDVLDPDTQDPTGEKYTVAQSIQKALKDPKQDIVAHSVNTQSLKVAIPADPEEPTSEENVILTAGVDGQGNNVIALNGATTVEGGLTADTLTMGGNTVNGFKVADNTGLPAAFDNSKLATSGYVEQVIGINPTTHQLTFNEGSLKNISEGDGNNRTAPTTVVGAIENISYAMGLIHGLVTETGGVKTFNGTSVASTNKDAAGNYIGNLKAGTSVSDDLVSLDNALGAVSTLNTDVKDNIVAAVNDMNDKVVHKANAETITGVKTFSNGLKVGADWTVTENSGALTAQIYGKDTLSLTNRTFKLAAGDNEYLFTTPNVFRVGGDTSPYLEAKKGAFTLKNGDGTSYLTASNGSLKLAKSGAEILSVSDNVLNYGNGIMNVSNGSFSLGKNGTNYLTANETFLRFNNNQFVVDNTGNVTAAGRVRAASLTFDGATTVNAIVAPVDADNPTVDEQTIATKAYADTKISKDDISTAWPTDVANLSDEKVTSEKLVYNSIHGDGTDGSTVSFGDRADIVNIGQEGKAVNIKGATTLDTLKFSGDGDSGIAASGIKNAVEDNTDGKNYLVTSKAVYAKTGDANFTAGNYIVAGDNLTQAAQHLDTKIYQDIHGDGDASTDDIVKIGDKAAITQLGNAKYNAEGAISSGSGIKIDPANKKITLGAGGISVAEFGKGADTKAYLNVFGNVQAKGLTFDGDIIATAIDDAEDATTPENQKTLATLASISGAIDDLLKANNTWSGSNTFTKTIIAQKGIQIGDHYKIAENGAGQLIIRDVATDKAKVVYKEGSLGLYATDTEGKNSSYFSILNGSEDPNIVDGMRLSSDGKAYFKALANQMVVINPEDSAINFKVENATGNTTIKGDLTAGDKAKAYLNVDNAEHSVTVTTQNGSNISGFEADGDTAGMVVTNGTNNYGVAAGIDATDGNSVFVGVTKEAGDDDTLVAGMEVADNGVGMGVGDENGKLVAGFSAEKGTDTNTIEMGAFDTTNDKLATGVSVDSTAKTVTIAANGANVVTVDKDGMKVDGDVKAKTLSAEDTITVGTTDTTSGDLTKGVQLSKEGTMTAKNGDNTASYGAAGIDVNGKFKVDAAGNVQATDVSTGSLTMANANFGGTVTVDSIDKGGKPNNFSDTALATTQSIYTKAQNALFTPENPAAEALKDADGNVANTIGKAINNIASNVDDVNNTIGDWTKLKAQMENVEGTNFVTENEDPEKTPSLVSAAIDLDNAIGDRSAYNNTHYANATGTTKSVSEAIASMDDNVYKAIHGTGSVDAEGNKTLGGTVRVGDLARTVRMGDESKQVVYVNNILEQTKIGNDDYAMRVDSKNSKTSIGTFASTASNAALLTGVEMDVNGTITAKDGTNTSSYRADGITVNTNKFTVDANGNTVAAGSLTAAGNAFTVVPADNTDPDNPVPAQLTMNGDANINGNENVTGNITVQAAGTDPQPKVEIKNDGSVKTTSADGTKTVELKDGVVAASDKAVIGTINTTDGTGTGVEMDNTGKITSKGADHEVVINNGDVDTYSLTMADADQSGASATTPVVKSTVTAIDTAKAVQNLDLSGTEPAFRDGQTTTLATVATVLNDAENAKYNPIADLKATDTDYATANSQTINGAIADIDKRIGDFAQLNKDAADQTKLSKNLTYNGTIPATGESTVVDMFNSIDKTLGTIHGLATSLGDAYKGNLNADATSSVEKHLAAIDTAIGDRRNYTAQYNIKNNQSVAESLDAMDLRMGDVASLGREMHYYREANPANVNLSSAVKSLDSNLYRLEMDHKKLRHETHAGLASAAALSALVPNPRGTGDTTLSFGTGAYQGHTAAAFGGFHWITNNLLVNAGVGWDNREATTRIGVSYSF